MGRGYHHTHPFNAFDVLPPPPPRHEILDTRLHILNSSDVTRWNIRSKWYRKVTRINMITGNIASTATLDAPGVCRLNPFSAVEFGLLQLLPFYE